MVQAVCNRDMSSGSHAVQRRLFLCAPSCVVDVIWTSTQSSLDVWVKVAFSLPMCDSMDLFDGDSFVVQLLSELCLVSGR